MILSSKRKMCASVHICNSRIDGLQRSVKKRDTKENLLPGFLNQRKFPALKESASVMLLIGTTTNTKVPGKDA
jgi:hypothetical protein